MDKIYINQLKIETTIGCLNWERHTKQSVILDLEIDFDIKEAGTSDSLENTLDYCGVSQALTEFIQASEFKLIESIAEQSASLILEKFSAEKVYLKVTKPHAIANAQSVAVSIERFKS